MFKILCISNWKWAWTLTWECQDVLCSSGCSVGGQSSPALSKLLVLMYKANSYGLLLVFSWTKNGQCLLIPESALSIWQTLFIFSRLWDRVCVIFCSLPHRPYWRCYYANTDAIIYVVDSADRERLAISKSELVSMLEVRSGEGGAVKGRESACEEVVREQERRESAWFTGVERWKVFSWEREGGVAEVVLLGPPLAPLWVFPLRNLSYEFGWVLMVSVAVVKPVYCNHHWGQQKYLRR